MFKNTQSKVWVTATSCPSPNTVFITTGAVAKAAIAWWGVQGSFLKNGFVKEKHKQTTPWQWQALCLLCLQSFQLRSNLNLTLVLWFKVVFIELSIMKAGSKLFNSHLKSWLRPSSSAGDGIEVINLIPRWARDRDYHFNLLTICQSADMKQQQRGVLRRTDSPQNFKIALPDNMREWTKFGYLDTNLPPLLPSHRTLA